MMSAKVHGERHSHHAKYAELDRMPRSRLRSYKTISWRLRQAGKACRLQTGDAQLGREILPDYRLGNTN
jgi:hypothetical protein